MKTLTLHQIFDKAAVHLLTQKVKSFDIRGLCAYRGDNKTMCAAGVFIDDEYYTKSMEGKTVSNPLVEKALKNSGYPDTNSSLNLLLDLQNIHDDVYSCDWFDSLCFLAKENRLNTNALNSLQAA